MLEHPRTLSRTPERVFRSPHSIPPSSAWGAKGEEAHFTDGKREAQGSR